MGPCTYFLFQVGTVTGPFPFSVFLVRPDKWQITCYLFPVGTHLWPSTGNLFSIRTGTCPNTNFVFPVRTCQGNGLDFNCSVVLVGARLVHLHLLPLPDHKPPPHPEGHTGHEQKNDYRCSHDSAPFLSSFFCNKARVSSISRWIEVTIPSLPSFSASCLAISKNSIAWG